MKCLESVLAKSALRAVLLDQVALDSEKFLLRFPIRKTECRARVLEIAIIMSGKGARSARKLADDGEWGKKRGEALDKLLPLRSTVNLGYLETQLFENLTMEHEKFSVIGANQRAILIKR